MGAIIDQYGELVFSQAEMQKRFSKSTYTKYIETIKDGAPLDETIAEDIARAMKEWALENGATHFTHWFQPQRSGTAEKHDAFISYDSNGDVIEKFSRSQLIQSEPDASSFPSGGIRSTFEARGYTAWDPSSPAFLRESGNGRSLVIPSIFLSWTGEALDMKTPLLRSIRALDHYAIQFQKLLGNRHSKRITVFSGLEQEYFLIPRRLVERRMDLQICGRTLFGDAPVKGQLMEDHYFGSIQSKVLEYMNALDQELYRYGIPIKTKHNEVAPNQFELAPLYEEINLAIDHNLLTMDIMKQVAEQYDFVVLHHEKPFAGLNGSGKHMNWSLGDNTGTNYLEPSKSPLKNLTFLMTLGALFVGMQKHSAILRAAISDAGNEHRMGSHEAPPAILSIYLGDYLTEILGHIEGAKTFTEKEIRFINHGLQNMPKVVKDISDRNRTSPVAFTGNKFELRALGSNANPSDAAQAVNLICAYGFKVIIEKLEKKGGNIKENCLELLKDILKETKAVRFEGNNYSDEWKAEAKKRKLPIVDTTPEAIKFYTTKDASNLFESFGVFSKRELESRVDIKLDTYSNVKTVEFKVAARMVRREILPSIMKQVLELAATMEAFTAAGIKSKTVQDEVKSLESLYSEIVKKEGELSAYLLEATKLEGYEKAYSLATKGSGLLNELRTKIDEAERVVPAEYWPLPTYDEMLIPNY